MTATRYSYTKTTTETVDAVHYSGTLEDAVAVRNFVDARDSIASIYAVEAFDQLGQPQPVSDYLTVNLHGDKNPLNVYAGNVVIFDPETHRFVAADPASPEFTAKYTPAS